MRTSSIIAMCVTIVGLVLMLPYGIYVIYQGALEIVRLFKNNKADTALAILATIGLVLMTFGGLFWLASTEIQQ